LGEGEATPSEEVLRALKELADALGVGRFGSLTATFTDGMLQRVTAERSATAKELVEILGGPGQAA
jgi:hypothetical protein